MTLFLDQGLVSGAQSGTAFGDLFTISRNDGNLGDTPVAGDLTVVQMTYAGGVPAGATAARLFNIINTNFGTPIVITALPGGVDPFSGSNITGNGATYIDSSSGSPIIRVVYDVNQCNFAGIFTFDTGGNPITTPNPVILYHELSHALRGAMGTTQPNDEIPARTDENVMRTALALCLRDINNNNLGCGPGNDCGGTTGGSVGCFIVSATTGSPTSAEVTVLRQLRDRVGAASGLAAELIDAIYGEYYQFSPGIAVNLQEDAVAREAVLWMVVRPLLAWYKLAGAVALDLADQTAVSRAQEEVSSACPPYFGGSLVSAMLEKIRAGEPLPADSPRLLLDFAPRLQEAARLRFASWAILDPLIRVWKSRTSDHDLIDEVSQWLATVPLEALAPPSNSGALDVELSRLAGFFGFKPTARRQLGARLALAWPDARTALERHGFV
jgi:hypothetical protein